MMNRLKMKPETMQAMEMTMKVMTSADNPTAVLPLLVILLSLLLAPAFLMAQIQQESQQMTFTSAQAAADKLYDIVEKKDGVSVAELFGAQYLYLLPLDELDTQDRLLFIAGWKKSHKLIAGEQQQTFIAVGSGGWTFPIPLVKNSKGWSFDTLAGAEIVKTRSIGRNELSTMQAILAYYDAQYEYAEQDRNGDSVLEFAQKFISTAGLQDGLYWDVQPGETLSPLGSLFTSDRTTGAYHGYHYKILKQQGKNARGGAHSYMSGNRMRFGFALLAWPAEYGDTGVMSFLINHDGVVYEKDLASDTDKLVDEINSFDPVDGWLQVEETF